MEWFYDFVGAVWCPGGTWFWPGSCPSPLFMNCWMIGVYTITIKIRPFLFLYICMLWLFDSSDLATVLSCHLSKTHTDYNSFLCVFITLVVITSESHNKTILILSRVCNDFTINASNLHDAPPHTAGALFILFFSPAPQRSWVRQWVIKYNVSHWNIMKYNNTK